VSGAEDVALAAVSAVSWTMTIVAAGLILVAVRRKK
jgi:hypothetical protein